MKWGVTWVVLLSLKDNSTKGFLKLLEFSHIMLIYAIEKEIAELNLTPNH